jgi:FixJ family two-component response regulator
MLLPLFLNLSGRRVLLVGGGPVAAAKLQQLLAAAADVYVVAPEVGEEIERPAASCGVVIERRPFVATDLDQVWLVVSAATPVVNREVAAALYLTPKTVEFHLTRIYRKLGVRSRSELVRELSTGVDASGAARAASDQPR